MVKVTDANGSTPREFSSLLDDLWRGWERGFDEGASFYSGDPETRIWDGTAVESHGKEAYARAARPFMEEVAELCIEGGDVQVWRGGDLAVTVAVLRNTGSTRGGEPFEETMRETLVWTPDGDGNWRIAHEHTSPLPEAAGPTGGP